MNGRPRNLSRPKTLATATATATATVDRLMNHAHITVTQGDSYRLTQATNGEGVKPFR
jgi:DNA replication protein DnaC